MSSERESFNDVQGQREQGPLVSLEERQQFGRADIACGSSLEHPSLPACTLYGDGTAGGGRGGVPTDAGRQSDAAPPPPMRGQNGEYDPAAVRVHAEIEARKEFPYEGDDHYRELAAKEFVADHGGAEMTNEDRAELNAKREFPNDHALQQLARRDALAKVGGESLSAEEQAKLDATREFPDPRESYFRDLSEKERMAKNGGPEMSPQDKADLQARREFPVNSYESGLVKKEVLAREGVGPELTREEKARLESARLYPNDPTMQRLMESVFLVTGTYSKKGS